MKKTIFLSVGLIILVLGASGCKTADFIWNPVGNWTWTITGSWDWEAWPETLTFVGTESGGVVSGWDFTNALDIAGTWTKTGDFTITVQFDFQYTSSRDVLDFTCSSSEAGPNSMSGSGTWSFYLNGLFDESWTMTLTGVKTTNLQ